MFHSGPVKDEFSQMLPYWKSLGSKNKSICFETLVEEIHETDSTEFIKVQTLASSDRNLTSLSTSPKGKQMDSSHLLVYLLNSFSSLTATMLNHIVTIHAIRKTPSLSKNLKTLRLSLAVSDLGVGLPARPMHVVHLVSMDWNEINQTS